MTIANGMAPPLYVTAPLVRPMYRIGLVLPAVNSRYPSPLAMLWTERPPASPQPSHPPDLVRELAATVTFAVLVHVTFCAVMPPPPLGGGVVVLFTITVIEAVLVLPAASRATA